MSPLFWWEFVCLFAKWKAVFIFVYLLDTAVLAFSAAVRSMHLYPVLMALCVVEWLLWCSLIFYIISAATLDIILSWNAWKSLKFSQILRYLLKFAAAAAWAVVLPIGYSSSVQNPKGLVKFFSSWARDWRNQSFYNYAVALYLLPNILAAIIFLLPPLRRQVEKSNLRVVTLLMWWAQASMSDICYFTLFVWFLLLYISLSLSLLFVFWIFLFY